MAGNALRNDDFRKLLAAGTPRSNAAGDSSTTSHSAPHSFTHKQQRAGDGHQKKKKTFRPSQVREKKEKTETDEIFDESDARLQSIMSKYRDRAAERRKGTVDGQDVELRAKIASGLHTFRDEERDLDAIDRREQEIRESKYLGGDIEHTHLVRGLDYQLLNKTRGEIKPKSEEVEEQAEIILAEQNPVTKAAYLNKIAQSKMSRAVCRTLFEFEPPVRNDLFQRGRMAFVVELDDPEQDVPITLLRSTFECSNDRVEQNISANNLVIEKLSEVLSYLRADKRKRKEKETKAEAKSHLKDGHSSSLLSVQPKAEDKIFDDVDEYVPDRSSKSTTDRNTRKDRDYFGDERKSRDSERDDRRRDFDHKRPSESLKLRAEEENRERPATPSERTPFKSQMMAAAAPKPPTDVPPVKKSKYDEEDAYGELFPSSGMAYGGDDSDDEDTSKMDMGPKKGPIKRWDFETEADYEKYQSGREALPKAAFQFGIKANAGRKTRKTNQAAEDRRLDREYEKISEIIEKKKSKAAK